MLIDDTDGQKVTFDLTDRLAVHHLDVTPHENRSSIEFVVHATLREVGEEEMAAVRDSQLAMERLTCSTISTAPD